MPGAKHDTTVHQLECRPHVEACYSGTSTNKVLPMSLQPSKQGVSTIHCVVNVVGYWIEVPGQPWAAGPDLLDEVHNERV